MGLKKELAELYIKRFPNTGNRTLSRKLYQENPEVYKDVEDARSKLRYIRGSKGKRNRSGIADQSNFKDFSDNFENIYNLPRSEANDFSPYKIEVNKILLLSDIHFPYHDVKALTMALEWGKKREPDCVILNGDTIDFYMLSRFDKDPRERSVAYELDVTRNFLDELKKNFPKSRIIFKFGNHDERMELYLRVKAPELLDCEEFELENLLKLRERGVEHVKSKRIIKTGSLNIVHGHEFGHSVFSPVNPARGFFMRAKANTIGGHHHQTSEHMEPNINGRRTGTWSTGCLCELNPKYMPINKWNHGFAFIEMDGEDFNVENKKIIDGKIR